VKIDIHAHLIDRHYYQALIRDLNLDLSRTDTGQTLMRRNGYTLLWYRDAMFDIDHRIRLMDSQGIDMRVLSLSSPNVYEWRGEAQIRMARHVNDMTAAPGQSAPRPIRRTRKLAASRHRGVVAGNRPGHPGA